MTGEELARHPELEPCELVSGRVVPVEYATVEQGVLVVRLGAILGGYADNSGRGKVGIGNVGIYTEKNPDAVRGADVLLISHERLARCVSTTFLDVAPELIAEILSPYDSWSEGKQKVREYLAAGVLRVWLVHPAKHQILIYKPSGKPDTLGIGDTLRDEEILPGFSLPLAELFRD